MGEASLDELHDEELDGVWVPKAHQNAGLDDVWVLKEHHNEDLDDVWVLKEHHNADLDGARVLKEPHNVDLDGVWVLKELHNLDQGEWALHNEGLDGEVVHNPDNLDSQDKDVEGVHHILD